MWIQICIPVLEKIRAVAKQIATAALRAAYRLQPPRDTTLTHAHAQREPSFGGAFAPKAVRFKLGHILAYQNIDNRCTCHTFLHLHMTANIMYASFSIIVLAIISSPLFTFIIGIICFIIQDHHHYHLPEQEHLPRWSFMRGRRRRKRTRWRRRRRRGRRASRSSSSSSSSSSSGSSSSSSSR